MRSGTREARERKGEAIVKVTEGGGGEEWNQDQGVVGTWRLKRRETETVDS